MLDSSPQALASRPSAAVVVPAPDDARYLAVKRGLDVLGSLVLLLLLLPVLAVIALAILIDSGRPVLYRQDRVGARRRREDGHWRWELQTFRILKFRTMVPDADKATTHEDFVHAFVGGEVEASDGDPAPYKLSGDPRVTRVGRWLRKTSLDELPQLVNILSGRMSLVGPRPVPPYEIDVYEPHHFLRLAGPPGLTGPWQVHGRGTATFEEMVRMDVEYLRAQSLVLDLRLLVRTVPSALSRKGAR